MKDISEVAKKENIAYNDDDDDNETVNYNDNENVDYIDNYDNETVDYNFSHSAETTTLIKYSGKTYSKGPVATSNADSNNMSQMFETPKVEKEEITYNILPPSIKNDTPIAPDKVESVEKYLILEE